MIQNFIIVAISVISIAFVQHAVIAREPKMDAYQRTLLQAVHDFSRRGKLEHLKAIPDKHDAPGKSQKTEIGALQNKDLRRKNERFGTFVGRVKHPEFVNARQEFDDRPLRKPGSRDKYAALHYESQ